MRRKAGGREKEGRMEMPMNRKMGRLMSRRKRRERWRRKTGLMPMRRRWRWTMIRPVWRSSLSPTQPRKAVL
jgi:hypothetical protein